jgi:hypothetical protein
MRPSRLDSGPVGEQAWKKEHKAVNVPINRPKPDPICQTSRNLHAHPECEAETF